MKSEIARTALAAALIAGFAVAGPALAAGTKLTAKLSGANEKPTPGDPKATGTATVTVDGTKVCYDLQVKDLAQPVAAHIHKGAADAAGPVALALSPPDASGHSGACVTADAKLAQDLVAHPGDYYVNVHSAQYKMGAIRGQLTK